MEGPISFWGHKEQESNLIIPKHDDDGSLLPSMDHLTDCYHPQTS